MRWWALLVLTMALPGQGVAAPVAGAPACRTANLRLTLADDGGLNGMSHGGVVLALHNLGPECTLAALAPVTLLDARGRVLPVHARVAPGEAAASVHLGRGRRATMTLRWVAGPVYPHNRSVRTAQVRLGKGGWTVLVPLTAQLYGPAGQPVGLERSALRVMDSTAADR